MTDTEPGAIEIDRSGSEPLVSIRHPPGPYTLDQVRAYASFLTVLADENAEKREPEVEELIAVLGATRARYLQWDAAAPELARAVLAAGYKRPAASPEPPAPSGQPRETA